MSPSSAPNLSNEAARIFRTAGGRDINLSLTSPPGSADNVPGAAQSSELLRVGCSGLGRSGEKFGSRKFLDSYIMPSRYHQSLTAGSIPNPHSGSDTEDLEDRRGFERREFGHDLWLRLPQGTHHQSVGHTPQHPEGHLSLHCFPMLSRTVLSMSPGLEPH